MLMSSQKQRIGGLVEETEGLSRHIERALNLIRRRGSNGFQSEVFQRLLLATENIVVSFGNAVL